MPSQAKQENIQGFYTSRRTSPDICLEFVQRQQHAKRMDPNQNSHETDDERVKSFEFKDPKMTPLTGVNQYAFSCRGAGRAAGVRRPRVYDALQSTNVVTI